MGKRFCLDTDVAIDLINGNPRTKILIESLKDCIPYISIMTLFELLSREKNLEEIRNFKSKVQILEFDESVCSEAASIFKFLKRKGKLMDYRDLFIASTAIVNNCALVTFNKKHFENIPHLELV